MRIHAFGAKFLATNGTTELGVDCPLIGEHQVDNAMTAIAALSVLAAMGGEFEGLSPKIVHAGIATTHWPGRLELVRTAPGVFLDGAHNPAGARVLAAYIRRFHADKRVRMIFGAMRDKDIHAMGPELFPLANELVFTTPNQARAFRGEELREISGEAQARVIDSPAEALEFALKAPPEDVVFITGSLYLVGEVRALLSPAG